MTYDPFRNPADAAGRLRQSAEDDRMIRRYVKGGGNEETGRELLRQLRDDFSDTSLPVALAYHGFISDGEAERVQLSRYDTVTA